MFEARVCVGGREFNPRPGQYSRMSFSSGQVTGKVFSPEHAFPSKFWIYLEHSMIHYIVLVGSSNYRPSAPFLYDVASHLKKTVIPAIIIIM